MTTDLRKQPSRAPLCKAKRPGAVPAENTNSTLVLFVAIHTAPGKAKKQACRSYFSDGMPVRSYSFFALGRASSSQTRRSSCFSMAVRRSSGRLMDGCRVYHV